MVLVSLSHLSLRQHRASCLTLLPSTLLRGGAELDPASIVIVLHCPAGGTIMILCSAGWWASSNCHRPAMVRMHMTTSELHHRGVCDACMLEQAASSMPPTDAATAAADAIAVVHLFL